MHTANARKQLFAAFAPAITAHPLPYGLLPSGALEDSEFAGLQE